MKKIKYKTLIIVFLFYIPIAVVYAHHGCCSRHGGQAYCDEEIGKWICSDGTYSNNCTCENNNYDTSENNYTSIREQILNGTYEKKSYRNNNFKSLETKKYQDKEKKDIKETIYEIIGFGMVGFIFLISIILAIKKNLPVAYYGNK